MKSIVRFMTATGVAMVFACSGPRTHDGADACSGCKPTEYCSVHGKPAGSDCAMTAQCLPIPAQCLLAPSAEEYGYAATCTCLEGAERAGYPVSEANNLVFSCTEDVSVSPVGPGGIGGSGGQPATSTSTSVASSVSASASATSSASSTASATSSGSSSSSSASSSTTGVGGASSSTTSSGGNLSSAPFLTIESTVFDPNAANSGEQCL